MNCVSKNFVKLCFVLVLLCVSVDKARAEGPYVVVNIGFKFGIVMTDQPSFLGGIELSVNYYKDLKGFGVLVSTEQWTSGRRLYHYALQGFWRIVGVSVGPSILTSKEEKTVGYAATFFGGAILLPYYRLSVFANEPNAHELGMYAKLPLPIVYPKFSLSGE
jgi:hypothetical protein